MSEINPEDPALASLRDHWHKIAALLLTRFAEEKATFSMEDVELLGDRNMCVILDTKDDILSLELLPMDEAIAKAILRGGLKV